MIPNKFTHSNAKFTQNSREISQLLFVKKLVFTVNNLSHISSLMYLEFEYYSFVYNDFLNYILSKDAKTNCNNGKNNKNDIRILK